MTIIDDKFEFSDAQNLVASGNVSSGNSVVSEDVVDLGSGDTDGFFASVTTNRIGEQAKAPVLVVKVSTTFTGAGAAVDVNIVSKASSASISSGGTTHGTIQIPAVSAAGTQVVLPLPWAAYNRYLGVLYTANGGNLTAGAVNAHIVEAGELID